MSLIPRPSWQLNVRMFGLAPSTKILERRRAEDDNPFFESTWMDAMGIMYADVSGDVHDVSIVMDPDLDRAGRPSLSVAFQGEAIAELNMRLITLKGAPLSLLPFPSKQMETYV
jgi:hypothetical protein